MAACNRTRAVEDLLARTDAQPPSFTVHLYQEHWVLNNGSKFLYHNQTACILDDIRAHRIPVDFLDLFDAAKVPFYDGCMIVELLDYRPQRNKEPTPEKPERTRVVLHPNSETLWADISSLNQKYGTKWTDFDALELESKILFATASPLCLDPDPHLTRIANHVLRVTTPTVPNSLKRKAVLLEPEEDENEKSRRAKIMAFGNPTRHKLHNPNYRLLDLMREKNRSKSQTPGSPVQVSGQQYLNQSQPQTLPPTQAQPPVAPSATPAPPAQPSAGSPTIPSTADKKLLPPQQPKAATPQAPYATPAYVQVNGSHSPMPPPQPVTNFIHQHPQQMSSPPSTSTPAQPQVYPTAQVATDATKRAATPAQPTQPLPPPPVRHPQQPYIHMHPQPIQQQSPQRPQSRTSPQVQVAPQPLPQTNIPQNHPQPPIYSSPALQSHHLQPLPLQSSQPPPQSQPTRSSQTPVPLPHLQPPQAVPSPVHHHSSPVAVPNYRPPSQPQQSQPQPLPPQPHPPTPHLTQASPQQRPQVIRRTPQLPHQPTPVLSHATVTAATPRPYTQSPKPPAPRPGPTPQPSAQQQQQQQQQQQVSQQQQQQLAMMQHAKMQMYAAAQGHLAQQNPAFLARFKQQQHQQQLMQQHQHQNAVAAATGGQPTQPGTVPGAGAGAVAAAAGSMQPPASRQGHPMLQQQQQQQLQMLQHAQFMANTGRAPTPATNTGNVNPAGAGAQPNGVAAVAATRVNQPQQLQVAAAAARGVPGLPQQQVQQQQGQPGQQQPQQLQSSQQQQQYTPQQMVLLQQYHLRHAQSAGASPEQLKNLQAHYQQQNAIAAAQAAQAQQQQQQGQGQIKPQPPGAAPAPAIAAASVPSQYYLQQMQMGYGMPQYGWPGMGRGVMPTQGAQQVQQQPVLVQQAQAQAQAQAQVKQQQQQQMAAALAVGKAGPMTGGR